MRRYAPVLASLTALALVLATAQALALSRRRTPTGPPLVVTSAAEGFSCLHRMGTRGSVVVILDSSSHVIPDAYMYDMLNWLRSPEGTPPVTEGSLVSALASSGIARQVYVVPPESAWSSVAPAANDWQAMPEPPVGVEERLHGVPIVFSHLEDLPPLEDEIVYLFEETADEYPDAQLDSLTEGADLVIEEER